MGTLIFLVLRIQVLNPLGKVLKQISELSSEPENAYIEVPSHASPEIVAMVELVQNMRERLLSFQQQAISEARFSVMGKLATQMAHEIRNPLEAISGAVELIASEVSPSALAKGHLGIIKEEIGILNDYLKEVLNITKPELGQPVLTDLLPLLQETSLLVQPVARKRNVSIEFSLPSGSSPAEFYVSLVDRSQIKRVFLNLLLNALEASYPGSKVYVRVSRLNSQVCVEVEDSGCGIPKEVLPKVFDPYVTAKAEGTGLGLALSKRIVEGYGGTIGIFSKEGEGTKVRFHLPQREV
ncbi:MAG: ATP-binding protein [Spirochaetales bacterium]